ncbi:MAG: dTMP kinase [Chloroflexota bacterium]|nr:dTMP kinase [Chloroflexota bacterium]
MKDQERRPGSGWFITVEGPDGAGKTLVTARLRDALEDRGRSTLATREPGGTAVGEQVRRIVLDHEPGDRPIDPRADALLFSAGRAQLVAEVIRPALERGLIVLDARHIDSTLAYQGYGGGLPIDFLRELQTFATDGLRPDLTVLLDVPVEVGLARKQADEQTRFEANFDVAFHQRVRDGYRALASAEPERFVVIDARAPVDDVVMQALDAIVARLGTGTEPAAPSLRMNR